MSLDTAGVERRNGAAKPDGVIQIFYSILNCQVPFLLWHSHPPKSVGRMEVRIIR
jgi:hypothetical protein